MSPSPSQIEALFSALVGSSDAAVVAWDGAETCICWSPAAERLFDRPASAALGLPIRAALLPEDAAELSRCAAATPNGDASEWCCERSFLRRDGSSGRLRARCAAVRDADGARAGGIAVFRDVGDLILAQGECAAAHKRLREAEEQRRLSIARELHDCVGQEITALALMVERASRVCSCSPGGPPVRRCSETGCMGETKARLQSVVTQIRSMSYALREECLAESGLAGAVRCHADRMAGMTGVRATVRESIRESRFAPGVEVAAFRIVQEALANVIKHSGTDRADVRLWHDAEGVGVEVADAGRGFDPAAIPPSRGLGLTGMRERAAAAGGSIEIVSAPGTGAVVRARFPGAAPG